jgi:hypothetical protein
LGSSTFSHLDGHSGFLQSQGVGGAGASSGSLSTIVAGFQQGHLGCPWQPQAGFSSILSVKIGATFSGSLFTISAAVVTGLQPPSGQSAFTESMVRANAARRRIMLFFKSSNKKMRQIAAIKGSSCAIQAILWAI